MDRKETPQLSKMATSTSTRSAKVRVGSYADETTKLVKPKVVEERPDPSPENSSEQATTFDQIAERNLVLKIDLRLCTIAGVLASLDLLWCRLRFASDDRMSAIVERFLELEILQKTHRRHDRDSGSSDTSQVLTI